MHLIPFFVACELMALNYAIWSSLASYGDSTFNTRTPQEDAVILPFMPRARLT